MSRSQKLSAALDKWLKGEYDVVLKFPYDGEGAPLRIAAYGDSLTGGMPSMEPYAKNMQLKLKEMGIPTEITVCYLGGACAVRMYTAALSDGPGLDIMGHVAPNLMEFVRARKNCWERPDVVMLMAGTNDFGQPGGASHQEVTLALKGLHEMCHKDGVPTIVLSIPDVGSSASLAKPLERFQRKGYKTVNGALAAWTRELNQATDGAHPGIKFVSTRALLPAGPKMQRKRYWEKDGVHWTVAGSKCLGERLAIVLESHLRALLAQVVIARQSEAIASAENADAVPSLENFLAAFDLEDEQAGLTTGGAAALTQCTEARYQEWQVEAVLLLQRWYRRLHVVA
mmetsp:Transcript_52010/g.123837  ORF Transcript_52010/g.123837 Transcript_52010/m.123837 type:complete len:341 (+) Transcript_52010:129-1151(+)